MHSNMRDLVLLALLGLAVSVRCNFIDPENCEVRLRTDAGWICGRVRIAENTYRYASFRKIPYGKPPLGRRRFADLEPVDPWEGLLDATEEGPACPTKELTYGRLYAPEQGMSEDCIHVNVHVPYSSPCIDNTDTTIDSDARLPILVNIHGGGYATGSGLTDVHGPDYLMRKNVIVVNFNYRLNVFGFLSLGSREIPGNQALRDVLALLRWVQRNAVAFGGDPDNVSLIGQSAGGIIAHYMSLARAAEGLFNRIILFSGMANYNFVTYPEAARELARTYLSYLDIESTDPVEIHNRLVELPLENIMQAYTIIQRRYGTAAFGPVVEDFEYPGLPTLVEDDPSELVAQGRGREYPTFFGCTNYEGAFFSFGIINSETLTAVENDHSLLIARFAPGMPEEMQEEAAERIFNRCFPSGRVTLNSYTRCLTEAFDYDHYNYAQYRSIVGAPTYMYRFSYDAQRKIVSEALWTPYEGATHCDDLSYIFRANSMMGDYISFPPQNNDDRMKDWMPDYVTNFMRCGNPTCTNDETNWPPLDYDNITYQEIVEPMMHNPVGFNNNQNELIQFYDSIDSRPRATVERLLALRDSETK